LLPELAGELRAAGVPGLVGRRWGEVFEPAADDPLEQRAVESVMAGASFAADRDDAGALEDVEVAGGGGPAVGEAVGEVAGGQLGSVVAQEEDDLPPRGVGEGAEYGIDFVEVGGGVSVSRATNY
jgi:hypothetical protein